MDTYEKLDPLELCCCVTKRCAHVAEPEDVKADDTATTSVVPERIPDHSTSLSVHVSSRRSVTQNSTSQFDSSRSYSMWGDSLIERVNRIC